MRFDDRRAVHGGMLSTSASSDRGVSKGGPTSGSGSSGSSRSSSSSSSSKSSSFFCTGFHHVVRPCLVCYNLYNLVIIDCNVLKYIHYCRNKGTCRMKPGTDISGIFSWKNYFHTQTQKKSIWVPGFTCGRMCWTWWAQLLSDGSTRSRTGIPSKSKLVTKLSRPSPSSSSSSSSSNW